MPGVMFSLIVAAASNLVQWRKDGIIAEHTRPSGRGWIGIGRAGLDAQAANQTQVVPESSRGEGNAAGEAPSFKAGRTSTSLLGC
jgi:hypothetical protein